MPSVITEADTDSLIRGIAASAFDAESDGAAGILQALVPGLAPSESRQRVERERLAAAPATRGRASARDIARFRHRLEERGLDGFLVPVADEYQGEFIPPCAQRLRWLSGFSGSAGLAVLLAEKAAIFVDGRYELQAANEVDPDLFEIHHVIRSPAAGWLSANTPEPCRIGFDPWLHSPAGVDGLKRPGIDLVAVEPNPIDECWTGRPAEPIGPIVPHELRHAGVPASEKLLQVGRAVDDAGWQAAVVTAPDSVAWLFNLRGSDVSNTPLPLSRAIVYRNGSADWFVDDRKLGAPVGDLIDAEVTVFAPRRIGDRLDRLGADGRPVAIDHAATPAWVKMRLQSAGAKTANAMDPCAAPKARKNPVEIDGARACHERDGAALCEFLAWLDGKAPDGTVTEIAAAERLERFRRRDPAFRGPSFDTISGAGPNGAVVHYHPSEETDRPLRGGDIYLVDSGAQYLDGTTDVTRTVLVPGGGEPCREVRDRFTRVLKGHIAIATTRFPAGVTGGHLDSLARVALWQVGLDYDHGTGHGVGSYLGVHEGPQRISPRADTVALEPGMILSNEPGYYRPGAYGIRIENLVVVQPWEAGGQDSREMLRFETLTLAPIDRRLVDCALLTPPEREWLNGYHERVGRALAPQLSPQARSWLEAAVAPV